jgi:alpha-ketoglutaric semialdehyde dehydrogenase
MAVSTEVSSYVAGKWREGPTSGSDTNPARPSEIVASVHLADARLAEEAVAAARQALPAWAALAAPARGDILRRAGDLIDERAEDIARDLTREEGKTLGEALREARWSANILRYHAAQTLDPDGETLPSTRPNMHVFTRREPLGVVTAITPWNFPMLIPAWKIAPALAFGNAVVWKPAEIVPLSATKFMRALTDAGLPSGVLNLVLGKSSQVGDIVTTDPRVNGVSFTGSTSVGRAIQAKAAAAGKKVQLEMGGKNPLIVLADADLDLAAEASARGAFISCGQKCTSTGRVIVERGVAKDFVSRLVSRAEAIKLGDPLEASTVLGPVSSHEQLAKILGFVERANAQGARTVAGGARAQGALAEGYFMTPSVLVDVRPDFEVARDEVFGPVAPVIIVDSYDEAIAVANDTRYGLTASVFTRDLKKAMRFTRESQAGIVLVNQETSGVEYYAPFGGIKDSGAGSRERGKASREFNTEMKTVYVSFP